MTRRNFWGEYLRAFQNMIWNHERLLQLDQSVTWHHEPLLRPSPRLMQNLELYLQTTGWRVSQYGGSLVRTHVVVLDTQVLSPLQSQVPLGRLLGTPLLSGLLHRPLVPLARGYLRCLLRTILQDHSSALSAYINVKIKTNGNCTSCWNTGEYGPACHGVQSKILTVTTSVYFAAFLIPAQIISSSMKHNTVIGRRERIEHLEPKMLYRGTLQRPTIRRK
jgi:hypothetical protein